MVDAVTTSAPTRATSASGTTPDRRLVVVLPLVLALAVLGVLAGARLTGKEGRNSIAVLNMQTEPEVRSSTSSLPGANYSVLRYGREFLTNSTAGVFYLGKERGGASNRLFGADLRFYPTRQWNIDGMVMRSETSGVGGGTAWRGGAQYDSGKTQYTVNLTSLGNTFRDELGFVQAGRHDARTRSSRGRHDRRIQRDLRGQRGDRVGQARAQKRRPG